MKIQEIRDIVRIMQRYENPMAHPVRFLNLAKKETFLGNSIRLLVKMPSGTTGGPFKHFRRSHLTTKYRSLKTYYVSRVIDNIPFLDILESELSEHTKAIYRSHKLLFYIRTLLALGSGPERYTLPKDF